MNNIVKNRDVYNTGQAGNVGPGSKSKVNNMSQGHAFSHNSIDNKDLMMELNQLEKSVRNDSGIQNRNVALTTINQAQEECKVGNVEKSLTILKQSGKWVFEQATKIGTTIISAYLKRELNL